jgi:hypothetical protein
MDLSKSMLVFFRTIQKALIGNVTPNLRAVYAFIEHETYGIIFYYDHPLSTEEQELVSLADTEFLADFPDHETVCKVEVTPYPNEIPKIGYCMYKRYERTE